MKATAYVMLANQMPEVRIEHGDETISFLVSVFGREYFTKCDVFEQINTYWASLPEHIQASIFHTYKEIQLCFDTIFNKNELNEFLAIKIKQLSDYHRLDFVEDWICFKSNIIIPDFKAEYVHDIDNNTSREKTYTKSDYVKLVTLSLVLRFMVPVWGEYIYHTRRETGTSFKEFYAFDLLKKTELRTSTHMEKLRTYIEHIVADDKNDPNNILNGIPSEDYGYWLLSQLVIRRLCIGEINGLSEESNLITLCYKYIKQKLRNNDSDHSSIVKPKEITGRSGTDGDPTDKISTLERYKIITDISLGEIVELEYSVRDAIGISKKITYQVTDEQIYRSLNTSSVLLQHRLLDFQINLLRWVFKPVISARGISHLSKNTIVKMLGCLEAVLWAKDYKYLALLSTSHSIFSDQELWVSAAETKVKIPKEIIEEIERIYPFSNIVNNSSRATNRVSNFIVKAIDNMVNNMTLYNLKATASDEMLIEVFGSPNRKITVKPDIKLELAKLVIQIGERSWV